MEDLPSLSTSDPLAPPQILASPGDVILLPGEISPHRDSPNHSCHIRYMVRLPFESLSLLTHSLMKVYFRVAIEIPEVYATAFADGIWSLWNPAIAPKERRRQSVISGTMGDAFLL